MLVKSRVKYIQSLSQKKLRDSEGLFVAEGPKIVGELLSADNIVADHIYGTSQWLEENRNFTAKIPFTTISESELKSLSFTPSPNQVIGIFKKPLYNNFSYTAQLSLVLDTIQDPGNMGTIIRCADWFGVKDIICSEQCVDAFSPKVVQSTMGSISRVRIYYENLEEFLPGVNADIYAAALDGTDITTMDRVSSGFLLIGNESRGIGESLMKMATKRVTIPRIGLAESLNAAVATGIILSHLALKPSSGTE